MFTSRLRLIDKAATLILGSREVAIWAALKKRAEACNKERNRLAHWQVATVPHDPEIPWEDLEVLLSPHFRKPSREQPLTLAHLQASTLRILKVGQDLSAFSNEVDLKSRQRKQLADLLLEDMPAKTTSIEPESD